MPMFPKPLRELPDPRKTGNRLWADKTIWRVLAACANGCATIGILWPSHHVLPMDIHIARYATVKEIEAES
jgi:hypothetical protein